MLARSFKVSRILHEGSSVGLENWRPGMFSWKMKTLPGGPYLSPGEKEEGSSTFVQSPLGPVFV